MSRGRYLHLDTDLVLRDAVSAQPYRIRLHRRLRSEELHHLDHPAIGVLVRIDPIAIPAELVRSAAALEELEENPN